MKHQWFHTWSGTKVLMQLKLQNTPEKKTRCNYDQASSASVFTNYFESDLKFVAMTEHQFTLFLELGHAK